MVSFIFDCFGNTCNYSRVRPFLAAKACGVKVLRFSLGFGPVLFKKKGKDNCEYAVSAIPLGGYVKWRGKILSLKIGVLYLKVHTNLKSMAKSYHYLCRPLL